MKRQIDRRTAGVEAWQAMLVWVLWAGGVEVAALGASASDDLAAIRAGFVKPDHAHYGPVPLWWWDADPLTEARLGWQLERLHEGGVHSVCIIQLNPAQSEPPYFSDGWWERMRFVCRQCKRLGMTLWFYDQIGFGSFGWQDRIGRIKPEYRGETLGLIEHKAEGGKKARVSLPSDQRLVSLMAYRETDGKLDGASAIDLRGKVADSKLGWTPPDGAWRILAVVARSWTMDPFNPDACRELVDQLYGEYDRRLGEFIGRDRVLIGSFQDELHLWGAPPYSRYLEAAFRKRHGYEIAAVLPAVFRDVGPKTDAYRVAYYETAAELATETFLKPIFDWHEKHGIVCGHDQWGRMNMARQVGGYGDYIRTQMMFQGPGYDDWGAAGVGKRNWRDAKLAGSIANLYGRPRVWFEAFHSSGWGLTTDQMVAWTNENYIYGANLYDKHGLYYTTHGGWWEWAAPSAHFRQPYWGHYRAFADWVTRLSYLMTRGRHDCDVALLFPTTAVQAGYTPSGLDPDAKQTHRQAWALGHALIRNAVDFDFIDAGSVAKATVEDGNLCVAGLRYGVLIIPPMRTLRRATLAKARQLAAAGGLVIFHQKRPTASATVGRGDPEVAKTVRALIGGNSSSSGQKPQKPPARSAGRAVLVPGGADDVVKIINEAIVRDFAPDRGDVYVHHRKLPGADLYFLFNLRDTDAPLTGTFRARGRPEIWDAFTGRVRPVHRYQRLDATTRVRLEPAGYEGTLLVFRHAQPGVQIIRDDFDAIDEVVSGEKAVTVRGHVADSRQRIVSAVGESGGKTFQGSVKVTARPTTIDLDGEWAFRLTPTMDNRWGDFRLPASSGTIGPEARLFRYRVEAGRDGVAAGWHRPGFDDGKWAEACFSFGPYFWALGPIEPKDVPAMERKLSAVDAAWRGAKPTDDAWRTYEFSRRIGIRKDPVHGRTLGPKMRVPDEFIDLGRADAGAAQFLLTYLRADKARQMPLTVSSPAKPAVWVNGQGVEIERSNAPVSSAQIPLKAGANTLLIRLNHSSSGTLRGYIAVGRQDGGAFRKANWIWFENHPDGHIERFFRREFELAKPPGSDTPAASATLTISADNGYHVYINGQAVGSDEGYARSYWQGAERYDVTRLLRVGRNVIAVRAVNMGGAGGLIAELIVRQGDAERIIATDAAWRVSREGPAGWTRADLDASGWAPAENIGPPPVQPWGMLNLNVPTKPDRPPRLRWFQQADSVDLDVYPDRRTVGWYRFRAPPGLRAMRSNLFADGARVWVDGQPVAVAGGRATLDKPATGPVTVAIRLTHQPGRYGGAAPTGPVQLDCGPGRITLGDWCDRGLATYAGIGVYTRQVDLKPRTGDRIVLDLGQVRTSARVRVNGRDAGIRVARPYRFDVTKLVRPGTNRIEVAVANTLANHYSAELPTRYVFDGQTVSGLLGPVKIVCCPQMTVRMPLP